MSLRASLCFFTRLPVGRPAEGFVFSGVVAWFPVVGLTVGLLGGLFLWLASLVLPPLLCGAAGCLIWIALTGGLHLDGVADCGDGMLLEAPKERRLEVMKDSRLGTYGAVALFTLLLFKAAALGTLSQSFSADLPSLGRALSLCAMSAMLGRNSTFLALRLPSARRGGMGSHVLEGVTLRHALIALAISLVICFFNGSAGLAALVSGLCAALLVFGAAVHRLGGVTGDVFGCCIEITECAALTACALV